MVSEPMIDQLLLPESPDAFPNGEGWIQAPESPEIGFPFDGSTCYEPSQGPAGPVSAPAIPNPWRTESAAPSEPFQDEAKIGSLR